MSIYKRQNLPAKLTIESSHILIANQQSKFKLQIFSHKFSRALEQSASKDIAVDGVGNIYALGDSEGIVLKYSPDGRLLARFGSSGDEMGQFHAPMDIAVDRLGRIYMSDIKGIQVFSSDGRYLDQIDVQGALFSMKFDSQGDLWVVTCELPVVSYWKQTFIEMDNRLEALGKDASTYTFQAPPGGGQVSLIIELRFRRNYWELMEAKG